MTRITPTRSADRRRARRVTERLERAYASPDHHNKTDPLDELIFIVLSQMTTGPSYERVFDRLKGEHPYWDEILAMPVTHLRRLIKDAGLSRTKAPRIKEILASVKSDFGSLTLEPLRQMDDRAAEAYLTSLPGVGTKTAKCVLMYSLARKVLPVDTHVFRVATRLKLLPSAATLASAHGHLEDAVDPDDRYSFHVNALAHGRQRCLAVHPRCQGCVVRRMCAEATRE